MLVFNINTFELEEGEELLGVNLEDNGFLKGITWVKWRPPVEGDDTMKY